MIKTFSDNETRLALGKSVSAWAENVRPVFVKVFKGPAQMTVEPVKPIAFCNLTGKMKCAAWWDNFGVYVPEGRAACAFAYAGGDIHAVFDRGSSFDFAPMKAKSMGFALELIQASSYLKYDFGTWSEQTRTRQAKRLLSDIRNFAIIPPVERLFLPWGAVNLTL